MERARRLRSDEPLIRLGLFDPAHSDVAAPDPSFFALRALDDKGSIPVNAKGLTPNDPFFTRVKLDLAPGQEGKAVPVVVEQIARAGKQLTVVFVEPVEDLDQEIVS